MKQTKQLGLLACSAIVAGNMMGSGIALLPSNLAKLGSITSISWIMAAIGALCLAFVFAKLGMLNPQEGGPIAYAEEVSPILGYQTSALYFNANWIGNLGIAIAGVTYLSTFFPALTHPWVSGLVSIGIVWLFTIINLFGANWIGRLTTIGVILLLIPVILTATVGWWFFHPGYFEANWQVSTHHTSVQDIGQGLILCLWSFIGLESATTDANLAKDPTKTVPRATMIGTGIAAIVYFLSCTAISGMYPAKKLAASGAPFALSNGTMFGHWAAPIVSAFTAFACLTSLGSWMLLVSQAGARSAHDGILPGVFGQLNAKGVPVKGLLITACMMSALMIVLMFFANSAQTIFGYIASIAVLMTILPYFYSVLNYFHYIEMTTKKLMQIGACIIAALFCFAAIVGTSDVILAASSIVALITLIFFEKKDRSAFIQRLLNLSIAKDQQEKKS